MRIHHVVLDGVAEGPLGVGIDIVATAARLAKAGGQGTRRARRALEQRVVSPEGERVRSAAGRPLHVDGALTVRTAGKSDVFIVPGLSAATEVDVLALLQREEVRVTLDLLARASQRGAVVAASCSATFLLGEAGLLDGKRATTTWWLAPVFARRFPHITLCAERMVVEEKSVFTAGAALAHADLVLAVVARLAGPSLAHLVGRYLLLDERPSQARFMMIEHLRTSDRGLRALERFVLTNLDRQLTLDELAKAAKTSTRTLARRVKDALGTTPQRLVQRLRVEHAAHLLQTTRASVDEVAGRVGYADSAAFRRAFRLHLGDSPRAHTSGARR